MSFVTSLRRRLHQPQPSDEGFTLIELLVTIIVASGIIAGLMYLAVETLQSDQRESDRTETQRDMQLALTFMESELRQAVFVYDAECLVGGGTSGCSGTATWGLDLPADMTPVLAFWRLQPFPQNVRDACAGGTADDIPCLSGNSYTLVVYSLGTQGPEEPLDDLKGQAGIFRSEMSITDAEGT
ncbi:MAG: prepilin-type N-terminal cleavage/methylation domain-containing protein, partial [Elainellaceae cyanobacterium]